MRSIASDFIMALALMILSFWMAPAFLISLIVFTVGAIFSGLAVFSVCWVGAEKINDYLDSKFNRNM